MIDEDVHIFTAEDRCDRCGAQAYMLATKHNFKLFFCFHHEKESGPVLFNSGWTIIEDHEGKSRLGYAPMGAY